MQAAMEGEAEAKRLAEEEKAPHRAVIQLKEFYQMYDDIIKNSRIQQSQDPKLILREIRSKTFMNSFSTNLKDLYFLTCQTPHRSC